MAWLATVAFILVGFLTLFGDGPGTYVDIAGAVVALGLLAFFVLKKNRIHPLKTPTIVVWSLFLAYLLIRIPFSIDIGYSIRSVMRVVDAFILYWLFYQLSWEVPAAAIMNRIVVFMLCILAPAVITGLIPSSRAILPSMSLFWSGDGHTHMSDILLVSALPIAVFVGGRFKRLSWGLLPCYILLFVFFRSRAALVIGVGATLLFSWFVLRKKDIKRVWYLLLVGALSVAAVLFIPRLSNAGLLFTTKSSLGVRLEFWHQAAVAFLARPLFGFGPGTFLLLSPRFASQANQSTLFAHGFALEAAAETGLVGLLLLLWVLFESCVRPIVRIFRQKNMSVENTAMAGSLVMLLANGLIDFSFDYFVVWSLFWIISGTLSHYE